MLTFLIQQTLKVNHWQEQTGETFSLALEQSTTEVKILMKVILVVWCHLKSPPSLAVEEMSISPQHFKAVTALQLLFIVICGYIKHSRSLQCEKICSLMLDPNFWHLSQREADLAVIWRACLYSPDVKTHLVVMFLNFWHLETMWLQKRIRFSRWKDDICMTW